MYKYRIIYLDYLVLINLIKKLKLHFLGTLKSNLLIKYFYSRFYC